MGLVPELAERYVNGRECRGELRPLTARNYRSALRSFCGFVGDLPASALKEAHIEGWLGTVGQRHRASTRCVDFSVVSGFCRWLVQAGEVQVDPMLRLERPRRPRHVSRYLPPHCVGELLAVCSTSRDKAIIEVLIGMGIRCQELTALDVDDWDQEGGVMLIRGGKGGHEREVPVPRSTAAALNAYLADCPVMSGPLFRSKRDRQSRLSPNHLSVLVAQWMQAAGVKQHPRDGKSAHALRHSAATDVYERCGDVRIVQQLLGHSNLATTTIYLGRVGFHKMREAMEGREYRTV